MPIRLKLKNQIPDGHLWVMVVRELPLERTPKFVAMCSRALRGMLSKFNYRVFLVLRSLFVELPLRWLSPFRTRVLVAGIGKTGTTGLAFAIAGSLRNPQVIFEPRVLVPEVKWNVVTKIISSSSEYLDRYRDYKYKILIVRDPRDRAVSACLYRWYEGHNPDPARKTRFLDLLGEKEKNPSSIPFHQLYAYGIQKTFSRDELFELELSKHNWLFGLEALNDFRWHILKYEDYVAENLEDLERYLGFSINSAAGSLPKSLDRVVRSKGSGSWRRWFTPEDVEYFKPLYSEILEKLGYDQNDWAITTCTSLDPAEGTDYIRTKLGSPKA